jgi:3-oxoacyl-ACP reductase-like protein
MSVFGNIMSSIFGHGAKAQPVPPAANAPAPATRAAPPTGTSTSPTSSAQTPVDVEAVLTTLASHNKEKLDWRKSIVDLMKLLDLDSSLAARKELAHELHYTGDTNDSVALNVWLHKQVMIKLAENGGKVPEALKH